MNDTQTSPLSEDEWPEPEPQSGFDWTLSMRDIEKKYSPLRPVVVMVARKIRQETPKPKPVPGTLLSKFRKKYPYIYGILEEENADLPRWLIDNMLKLSV